MSKPILTPILLIAAVTLLTACAAGPNAAANTAGGDGSVAGFWLGLWHGIIVLFTFLISLFADNMSVYEVHNNGGWYNAGFVLGVAMFFGGGGGSATRLNVGVKIGADASGK